MHYELSGGEAGIQETARGALPGVIDDAADNSPLVQQIAAAIVADAPRRDVPAALEILWQWLRKSIHFKKDTHRREHLRHPDQLITEIARRGRTSADCDCVTALGCSLLKSMGLPAYIVLASRAPDQHLEHVFFGTAYRGEFIPLDPQEGFPPGVWPTDLTRREIIEV